MPTASAVSSDYGHVQHRYLVSHHVDVWKECALDGDDAECVESRFRIRCPWEPNITRKSRFQQARSPKFRVSRAKQSLLCRGAIGRAVQSLIKEVLVFRVQVSLQRRQCHRSSASDEDPIPSQWDQSCILALRQPAKKPVLSSGGPNTPVGIWRAMHFRAAYSK